MLDLPKRSAFTRAMSTLAENTIDLATTNGPMRVHSFSPVGDGAFPSVVFFSEIFQVTGPIRRMAAALAGHGYWVLVPEVYHEFEVPGSMLAYDQAGSDRGNELKYTKTIASYDDDVDVLVKFLSTDARCNGRIASYGVCLGGHLALRAGLHEGVSAVVSFYPTDVHTATLGAGKADDTLRRFGDIKAPLLLVFGRQDPHIPQEGRVLIQQALVAAGANFEWHEFNAAHAFLRDEGPRYNPALARVCETLMLRFFDENLR